MGSNRRAWAPGGYLFRYKIRAISGETACADVGTEDDAESKPWDLSGQRESNRFGADGNLRICGIVIVRRKQSCFQKTSRIKRVELGQ